MANLKPCPYRHVSDEGHILCDKIKSGDREVSPNICRVCPVSHINCAHLRSVLDNQTHPPVVVRYGNGKTEIWEDPAPAISFKQAACAAKVVPIHSPRDCAGCALRQALVTPESISVAPNANRPPLLVDDQPQVAEKKSRQAPPRPTQRAPVPQPSAQAPQIHQPVGPVSNTTAANIPATPAPDARSKIVAAKIIQLQEWLLKQKNSPPKNNQDVTTQNEPTEIPSPLPRPRVVGEERRVGWTD